MMTDIVERLRKMATVIYIAVETTVADNISSGLLEAADEIERLREVIRQRTFLLDQQMGTPCEQIRHEQEIERLRAALKRIDGINDNPADFNVQIEAVLRDALQPPDEAG